MVQLYPKSEPIPWDDDYILATLIEDILNVAVNRKATPGIPYCALEITNEKLIQNHKQFILNCVKQRLRLLAVTDVSYLRTLSATERVQLGFCDPIRVFVKNEPHSKLKISQKRYRLISCISIVDQVIERILHTAQNEEEIANWRFIPSKPGGSMCKDEDVKYFANEVFNKTNLVDVDISGWDWTVQGWELELDARLRVMLAVDPTEHWINAVYNRMFCLSRAVFVFADGECVEQCEDALQKSGSFNTASSNSRMKISLAHLIGCKYAVASGDDAIEDYVEGAVEKYLALGHPVKEYNRCTGDILFCSSRIRCDGTWSPETWGKTFYRFLSHKDVNREWWQQFLYTLRHSPHIGRIRAFLRSVGGELGEKINGWEEEEERSCKEDQESGQESY